MSKVIPLFEPTPRPEGRDRETEGDSRAEVAEWERRRLLSAIAELMTERGYACLTVADLTRRAEVPQAAFYEHFADKEECLMAAYREFTEAVVRAMARRIDVTATWTEFVEAILGGYVEVLERDPTAARAFTVEMDAAGDAARQRRRDAIHMFARLLADRHAEIRAHDPSLAELPSSAYLALALAARESVQDALLDLDGPPLGELVRAIALLFNAAVHGAAANVAAHDGRVES
jgi:AcrR family transcriptional regulator